MSKKAVVLEIGSVAELANGELVRVTAVVQRVSGTEYEVVVPGQPSKNATASEIVKTYYERKPRAPKKPKEAKAAEAKAKK